eukprot:scaffold33274_cov31-Prasinocladus_malaysianus.AAC.2
MKFNDAHAGGTMGQGLLTIPCPTRGCKGLRLEQTAIDNNSCYESEIVSINQRRMPVCTGRYRLCEHV